MDNRQGIISSVPLVEATHHRAFILGTALGISAEDISKRKLDLGLLKSAYERLYISLKARDKIQKDKFSITEKYENYRAKGMVEKPPYTLTLS